MTWAILKIDNTKIFAESSFQFVEFTSYIDVKEALDQYSFGRRATDRPWSEKEPMLNFDDYRFWEGKQFEKIVSDTPYIESAIDNN